IQLSGLYALLSAWMATDPSAFNMISRSAGGSRAARRPWYSTEQRATSSRTGRVVTTVAGGSALGCSERGGARRGHQQRRLQARAGAAHPVGDRRLRRGDAERDLWPAGEEQEGSRGPCN